MMERWLEWFVRSQVDPVTLHLPGWADPGTGLWQYVERFSAYLYSLSGTLCGPGYGECVDYLGGMLRIIWYP
jgi:hypothetical protein